MNELPHRTPGDAIRRAQFEGSSEAHSVGVCSYCQRWADPAVVVALVHANSGPGWVRYAHPGCAAQQATRTLPP
ncbi:MAG: hypothetical protein ACRDPK_06155 [Carbonactinosporaceae bacterium]